MQPQKTCSSEHEPATEGGIGCVSSPRVTKHKKIPRRHASFALIAFSSTERNQGNREPNVTALSRSRGRLTSVGCQVACSCPSSSSTLEPALQQGKLSFGGTKMGQGWPRFASFRAQEGAICLVDGAGTSDYGSEGWGFESLRAYRTSPPFARVPPRTPAPRGADRRALAPRCRGFYGRLTRRSAGPGWVTGMPAPRRRQPLQEEKPGCPTR